jgi:hypothetical protein
MADYVCSNCGKKHRWYEPIKRDPVSKQPVCRKCFTPFGSMIISPEKTQEIKPKKNQDNTPLENNNSHPIDELVTNIFSSFNRTRKTQKVITFPSIPILYLGDLIKYKSSKQKIITVGLNPHHNEFPPDSPYIRFKHAKMLETSIKLDKDDIETYLNLLNSYFIDTPEKRYNSFTPILDGLKTSYNSSKENSALHTNLCSPFAIDKKWSKLSSSTQYTLSRDGRKFWHKLVNILKPDIILFSVEPKYLKRVMLKKSGWKNFRSITTKANGTPRVKPYNIMITESRIGSKKTYLVNGIPSYLPFGSISNKKKLQIGKDLEKKL